MRREEGFTLLETLVALIVAAMAAAVIAAAVRGEFQRAEMHRRHASAAIEAANRFTVVRQTDWRSWQASPDHEKILLGASLRRADDPWPGTIEVYNHSLQAQSSLPPPEAAYTPLQRVSVTEADGRYALSFIAPSLPPPR